MNYHDYSKAAEKTMAKLANGNYDQMHMVLGIASETGELVDAYKKMFAYGKALDLVNVKEEIGDLFWYMFNLMRILDLDFEDVLEVNANKLRARYGEEFLSEKALHRDLETERKILENKS
jgi:NTP pyrophosphatase (non-canonical NTP hydrolase)